MKELLESIWNMTSNELLNALIPFFILFGVCSVVIFLIIVFVFIFIWKKR